MFTDGGSKEHDLEGGATAFWADIANKEKAKDIQEIRIEPKGDVAARYVITYKNKSDKAVVNGEYFQASADKIGNAGIPYQVKQKDESSIWPQVLVWWLPMLLLIGIFFLFMRQLQSGGGKAMSFGK